MHGNSLVDHIDDFIRQFPGILEDEELLMQLTRVLNLYGFNVMSVAALGQLDLLPDWASPALLFVQGDAVLFDVQQICQRLKGNFKTSRIRILVVGQMTKDEIDTLLELGIEDYLLRPATSLQVISRVNSILSSHMSSQEIERITDIKTQELLEVQAVLIESLATLAEFRDEGTGKHIKRTQNYVKALAIELRKNPPSVKQSSF